MVWGIHQELSGRARHPASAEGADDRTSLGDDWCDRVVRCLPVVDAADVVDHCLCRHDPFAVYQDVQKPGCPKSGRPTSGEGTDSLARKKMNNRRMKIPAAQTVQSLALLSLLLPIAQAPVAEESHPASEGGIMWLVSPLVGFNRDELEVRSGPEADRSRRRRIPRPCMDFLS